MINDLLKIKISYYDILFQTTHHHLSKNPESNTEILALSLVKNLLFTNICIFLFLLSLIKS